MRELVFKSLTSLETKKRDFWVQEVFEKDGVLARTERRCLYFVTGKTHIDSPEDIANLTNPKIVNLPHRKRHYYVLKTHDSRHGEDRLICKVAGSFYAVCGNNVYSVVFVHTFKVSFTVLALSEGKNPDGDLR